jgi:hypothetical protein
MASVATLRARLESSLPERLSSTLLLRERIAPLMIATGVTALDALTGGLPRGALSEIAGQASSGRTGVILTALAGATRRQEACALVDASDSFDPASAVAAGVDLERLLWVRCSNMPRRKFGAAHTALSRPGPGSPLRAAFATNGTEEPGPITNVGFAFGEVLEQVHGRARSGRHSARERATDTTHLVVSFSPRRGAYHDRVATGGTGTLRQNLRVAGSALGA